MGNGLKLSISEGEISLDLVNTIKQMIKEFDNLKFLELIHMARISDHFLRAKNLHSAYRCLHGPSVGGTLFNHLFRPCQHFASFSPSNTLVIISTE